MITVRRKPGRRELLAEVRRIARLPAGGRPLELSIEQVRQLVLWMRQVNAILSNRGRGRPNGAEEA